jgi:hypothetical protein
MDALTLIASAIPALFVAFVVVRLIRVGRVIQALRRPERIGGMLSPEVRSRLEAAGIEPDALDLAALRSLEADPELQRRIRAELHAAFGQLLAGRASAPAMQPASIPTAPRTGSEDWSRPLPIDPVGARGAHRWKSVLLLAALLVCCGILLQR